MPLTVFTLAMTMALVFSPREDGVASMLASSLTTCSASSREAHKKIGRSPPLMVFMFSLAADEWLHRRPWAALVTKARWVRATMLFSCWSWATQSQRRFHEKSFGSPNDYCSVDPLGAGWMDARCRRLGRIIVAAEGFCSAYQAPDHNPRKRKWSISHYILDRECDWSAYTSILAGLILYASLSAS